MSGESHYGHYSPYYQYLGQGHEEARVGNAYQQGKHQPLSAHQAQSTATAANSLGGQVYDKVTSASSQPVYESSTTHRAGRSSVDAANLGNLAHASSEWRLFADLGWSISISTTTVQWKRCMDDSGTFAAIHLTSTSAVYYTAHNQSIITSLHTFV